MIVHSCRWMLFSIGVKLTDLESDEPGCEVWPRHVVAVRMIEKLSFSKLPFPVCEPKRLITTP